MSYISKEVEIQRREATKRTYSYEDEQDRAKVRTAYFIHSFIHFYC